MKHTNAKLTAEERDVLILAVSHSEHLNNAEIAQRLGVSVSRVKTLTHQACIKLGAQSKYEAIFFALRRGEIAANELHPLDALIELLSPLGPDMLRRIAHLMRQRLKHGHLRGKCKQIIPSDKRKDAILTQRERDTLILVGQGLTNKEIADRLCISLSSVRTFLNQACIKLGAHKRADACMLALKQREITVGDLVSINELVQSLTPLGAESIEKMAQLLNQKPKQELTPTGS